MRLKHLSVNFRVCTKPLRGFVSSPLELQLPSAAVFRSSVVLIALILCTVGLTACGGGGGNNPEPTAEMPTGGGSNPEPTAEMPTGGGSNPEPTAEMPTGGGNNPEPTVEMPTGGGNNPEPTTEMPTGGGNNPEPTTEMPMGGGNNPEPKIEMPTDRRSTPDPIVEMPTNGGSNPDPIVEMPTVLLPGPDAISGIDRIPSSMVKRTNTWMQNRWVIVERDKAHATFIGNIACRSYVMQPKKCNREDRTGKYRKGKDNIETRTGGSAPYTEILDVLANPALNIEHTNYGWIKEQISDIGSVKIVNMSEHYWNIRHTLFDSANNPWLTIHSTSNTGNNNNWFDTMGEKQKKLIKDAIAANKLIFVSAWRKKNGNYERHPGSSSCRGVNAGCLWVSAMAAGSYTGTSGAAPQLSAALASVLAVFPTYSAQDLWYIATLCAKRKGNGIEKLLKNSGGTGVADFNCIFDITTALSNLPGSGPTDMSIKGRNVNFGDRGPTVSFAPSRSAWHFIGGDEKNRNGFHFRLVPNGKNAAMAFATFRKKAFFASFGIGKYDSFFGFKQGHGEVFGSEIALGNETFFVRLVDIRSRGDELISRAEGQSFGVTTEREFHPMERVTLRLSANFDKFLGGTAKIPFGRITMNEGQWNRQTAVSTEYATRRGTVFRFDTRVFFPQNAALETQFGLSIRREF